VCLVTFQRIQELKTASTAAILKVVAPMDISEPSPVSNSLIALLKSGYFPHRKVLSSPPHLPSFKTQILRR
jgi:hypothetical protein